MAVTTAGKNRIMIYGPKDDGTYVVEFKTAAGEALAISIPRAEAAIIRHFHADGRSGAQRSGRPFGLTIQTGQRVLDHSQCGSGVLSLVWPAYGAASSLCSSDLPLSPRPPASRRTHCQRHFGPL